MTVATDSRFIAQGAVHGLTQSDTNILYGMVIVNVKVSLGGNLQVHQAMTGYLLQHVFKERYTGIKFALSTAVKVQGNGNSCFSRISFDLGDSISHVKVCFRLALMNVGVVQIAAMMGIRWVTEGTHLT